MSPRRILALPFLALLMGLPLAGCDCGNQKVSITLKKEGDPCAGDDQCETGLCNGTPKGSPVCRKSCTAGCNFADICTSAGSPDGGTRFVCVPDEGGLCASCNGPSECAYWADQCVKVDGKSVCGRDCSFDGQCPTGYVCSDPPDVSGKPAPRQCVPKTGTCECTPAHAGAKRSCSNSNALGTCTGLESCDPDAGWTGCTAHVPEKEICNGLDDNCNGKVDERSDEVPNPAAGIAPITCGQGACFVSIAGCFDGGVPVCVPKAPRSEACNGLDDDCDGTIDNGFPGLNQACTAGLGRCQASGTTVCRGDGLGTACTAVAGVPAGEVCNGIDDDCNGLVDDKGSQTCGQGVCQVTMSLCADGGAGACVPDQSKKTTETCNGLDDNCNGVVDDGFNVQTDPANCGTCGHVCAVPNGSPGCDGGACSVGSCNPTYADCDKNVPNGCEVQTTTDTNNCATCGHVCSFAHAAASCVGAGCVMGACAAGWVDLDQSPTNGCEYACTPTGTGVDFPDDALVDSNCDGIDGTASRAVFVDATNGSDGITFDGSMAKPYKTIGKALSVAVAGSRESGAGAQRRVPGDHQPQERGGALLRVHRRHVAARAGGSRQHRPTQHWRHRRQGRRPGRPES